MSQECAKSMMRRLYIPAFHQKFFVGRGIDIGSGDDSLAKYAYMFPRITSVDSWDKEQGDAQFLDGIEKNTYDFVHSSHCLEHLVNPAIGLSHWYNIVKPGGHLIITVPDVSLYEHGKWPSQFNDDHKWAFTLDWNADEPSHVICISDLIAEWAQNSKLIRSELIESTFNEQENSDIDQTLGGIAECSIEFVLRKPT